MQYGDIFRNYRKYSVMCRIVILLDEVFLIYLEEDKPLRATVGIVLHLQRVQNIEENYKVAYN